MRMWRNWNFPTLLVRKTAWQFLKRLNTELPFDPAVTLLDINIRISKRIESIHHAKTYTEMFIAY